MSERQLPSERRFLTPVSQPSIMTVEVGHWPGACVVDVVVPCVVELVVGAVVELVVGAVVELVVGAVVELVVGAVVELVVGAVVELVVGAVVELVVGAVVELVTIEQLAVQLASPSHSSLKPSALGDWVTSSPQNVSVQIPLPWSKLFVHRLSGVSPPLSHSSSPSTSPSPQTGPA